MSFDGKILVCLLQADAAAVVSNNPYPSSHTVAVFLMTQGSDR